MKHFKLFFALFAMLALGVSNAWAETATITFKNQLSGTSDGSTAYTTSNFVSSGIDSSDAAFGTITCSATSKCYSGKTGMGLKAGGSSAAGSFTITFSTPLVNVSKVTLNAAAYRSDKSVDITVKNGSTQLSKITSITNTTLYDIDIADLNIASFNTLTIESTKYCYIKSITITYNPSAGGETPDPTPVTVTLDKTELSLQAGATETLTATVTGSTESVTWSSSATGVASVDNTGKVTAVAAGNATITAAIGDVKATCAVTVTAATTPDPEPDPETPEGAITCAEAVEVCQATGTTPTTGTYTIHGYVTSIITAYSSKYGNISFWMADTKDGGEVLQAYRVKPTKTGEENVKVGDKVEVIGTLVNYYGNTPEVNAGGTYTILEVAAGGETPDPEEPETPGEGGDNVTYVFANDANNPGNAADWLTGTIDSYTTWTATKGGSNNPKYYNTGSGLRVYNGGTFSITSEKLIETVTLTFSGTGYTFSSDNTDNPQTVTVNANSYEWSVGRTCRLQKIEIVYGSSDVVIVKTLQSIALSGMTTTYDTGDVFNFNGTCTATYAVTKDNVAQEDEQKVVTPTSVTEPDMSTTGEKEVTVTYTEKDVTVIATYTITVNLAEGDKLVLEKTGVEGTSYVDWSNVQGASGAVYAGNSAGGNNSIQLRKSADDKPAAGIITTTSGGLIRKVKVGWNINTADGRTLNVYGKNSAYTAVSELYDNATAGELLGTIVEGTSTELVINGDFEYVGLVSADGALYLDKVVFVWEENEESDGPATALDNIAIEGKVVKTIINGQLIIIKNGVKYNAQGQVIK